ncbi:unnamed protein product [Spirodela intermedia]|uniref:Uncharacterized protein n=1 Tax=Spirodela intermedia TaxID=51605 RepID=A0A7I8JJ51_SPIIN|nr:unnamed protein product [Spirodela intermedia]CAA6669901.1 unnamed protein product [Spirodela intermedia]
MQFTTRHVAGGHLLGSVSRPLHPKRWSIPSAIFSL